METQKLWGKIKKTVTDGVTVASEKTEEFTKFGKAKLDVLNTRRKITKKHGEMGRIIYTMLKEGKTGNKILQTEEVEKLVDTLKSLDSELEEKEKICETLKKKADENIEEIKSKTKAGFEDLRNKAKEGMNDLRNRAKPVIKKMKEKTEFIKKGHKKDSGSKTVKK
ncbi:MAG: hypothetical protein WCU00_10295 [Candidatus Latescibacterota bacterium]